MTSQEPDKIVLNEENTEKENKDFDDDFEDEFQDEELPATDLVNQLIDVIVKKFFITFPISCPEL